MIRYDGHSPVGTIEEWKEFVMDRPDFNGLRIIELDGNIREKLIKTNVLKE